MQIMRSRYFFPKSESSSLFHALLPALALQDLAPHGIRVNAISPALIGPGYMWTRQNELHAQSGSPYFATDPDEVAKGKINRFDICICVSCVDSG